MNGNLDNGSDLPLSFPIELGSLPVMIEIAPPESQAPQKSHIPFQHSLRWVSPYEGEQCKSQLAIFMTQNAFIRACAHAGSDIDNEVGGWLVGKRRSDDIRIQEFIVIEKVLPASYTKSGKAYLTFTQESQVEMHAILEKHFPGKEIVGWYHTHPSMGIFLSEQDTWLHKNFFQNSWQVALVIEPVSSTGGFFIPEEDGQLDSKKYFGFYELLTENQQSVVHWNNMTLTEPETDGGTVK